MPAKRRKSKTRSHISAAAVARYRQNPAGLEIDANGAGVILDDELAALLGRHVLIAYPDLELIKEQMEIHNET